MQVRWAAAERLALSRAAPISSESSLSWLSLNAYSQIFVSTKARAEPALPALIDLVPCQRRERINVIGMIEEKLDHILIVLSFVGENNDACVALDAVVILLRQLDRAMINIGLKLDYAHTP